MLIDESPSELGGNSPERGDEPGLQGLLPDVAARNRDLDDPASAGLGGDGFRRNVDDEVHLHLDVVSAVEDADDVGLGKVVVGLAEID